MTFFENDEAALAYESEWRERGEPLENITETDEKNENEGSGTGEPLGNITETDEKTEEDEASCGVGDGRDEYEALVKDKYKEFYAADTQRLINRRFKKYKALEEKVKRLEDEAARYADLEGLILSAREQAISETEERMNREFRLMRSRAGENALVSHVSRPAFDVSKLTKSERAGLALRAQKGEKIHF